MVGRLRREGRQHDVEDQRPGQTGEHHSAATQPIEERGSVDGPHHREDRVDGVDKELCAGVGDPSGFNHLGLE